MAHVAGCSLLRCTYGRPSSAWCVEARPLGLAATSRVRPCRVACPTTNQSSSSSQMPSSAGQSHDANPALFNKPTQQHGGQQQHAWLVFKQCMMLAAAAFGGAPLILVLDVAENACLAVGQLQQIKTQLFAATVSSTAGGRQHAGNASQQADQSEGFMLSNAQQQDSQSQVQHVAACAVLAAAAAGSSGGYQQPASSNASNSSSRESNAGHQRHMYNSTASNLRVEPLPANGNNKSGGNVGSSSGSSTAAARPSSSSSNSNICVSRSSSRRPVMDLLPPWTPMALTVVPAALLAMRHLHTESVLRLLLWCGGSLVCQAYVNLLLVVLQRRRKQSLARTAAGGRAAAAAGPAHASLLSGALLDTSQQQQQGPREQSPGGAAPSPKTSSHGWWAAGEASRQAAAATGYACATAGQGHQAAAEAAATDSTINSSSSSSSSGSSRVAKLAVVVFEALQLAGDGFRVWCLCSAGWLVWQYHAAAAPGHWASCLAAVHRSMAAMDVGHLLGAATAAAVSLHCFVDWCFWLVVEVGLAAAGAAVYALAVLPRVLPSVNSMCQ